MARLYGVFSSRVLPSRFVGGPTAVTIAVAFVVLGSLVDFYSEILNTFLICIGIFLCGFHGFYSEYPNIIITSLICIDIIEFIRINFNAI